MILYEHRVDHYRSITAITKIPALREEAKLNVLQWRISYSSMQYEPQNSPVQFVGVHPPNLISARAFDQILRPEVRELFRR